MSIFSQSISSRHFSRRDWLRVTGITAAGGALALAGCKSTQMVGGTFLQPWQEHMDWKPERWRSVLTGMVELGCDSLFLQWVGIEGEASRTWEARGRMLQTLLDEAGKVGLGVNIGLPYNERWWDEIDKSDINEVSGYMQSIGRNSIDYMRSVTWQKHPAFEGWYIPYEIEQYHWGPAQRRELLAQWLKPLSEVAIETSGHEPAISTYYSEMASPELLAQLWSHLLDRVRVRPMIQDGVGVHGMNNYANLEPLHQMLLKRAAPFDLVVELFERLPATANMRGQFQARTAAVTRLRDQWKVAQGYGAQRVVAFALEPWASQNTPEGVALRSVWKLDRAVELKQQAPTR
ncbi:DUF4434 domain-containing protein [Diaphorobacter aerolatus]|uniref:DUF4434 domain-containing protein n=1 Tax=Diaphorobacter aerolatus TaxID=1288495 RepID=A0A7H0GPU8_9BURK|nr:DUF4434 domain-containing protein [Diaphorobacter aerolatus]QNP50314.1 DUF4434 domain-containing protein [Diaphorobacter aerolatus]